MKPEDLIGEEGCKFVAKTIKERKIPYYPISVDWGWDSMLHRLEILGNVVLFRNPPVSFSIEEFDRFLAPQPDPRFNVDGFPIYAPTRERLQRYVNELYAHSKNNRSQFYDVSYNVVCSFDAGSKEAFTFKGGAENSLRFSYTMREIQDCW